MNLEQRIKRLEDAEKQKKRKFVVFPRFYKGQYYIGGEPIEDLGEYMRQCGAKVAIVNDLPRMNEKENRFYEQDTGRNCGR